MYTEDADAESNPTGSDTGLSRASQPEADASPARLRRTPWAEAWRSRDAMFGTFIQFPNPSLVEVIGHAGLDFAVMDLEHGELGIAEVPALCRAADVSGLHAIVRAGAHDPVTIGRALDYGASAVLIPHIETADDAAAAVAAAKYPPLGSRGAYPMLRASRYGAAWERGWEARENERNSVILLIEDMAGIDNLQEIMRTPGVAGIFIGPVDLSHSLGLAGDTQHPRVQSLVRQVGAAALAAGLQAGTFCPTVEAAAEYARAGFKLLAHSVDSQILRAGYTAARRAFWRKAGA